MTHDSLEIEKPWSEYLGNSVNKEAGAMIRVFGQLLLYISYCFCQSTYAPDPYGYRIHQFDGHCNPDGTCTYTLQIPVTDALVNPHVMDNSTAASMIAHLANHDQQIDQILGLFGHNTSSNVNLIEEVTKLKNQEENLNNLVKILTDEVHNLLSENGVLKTQLSYVNQTILGRLSGRIKTFEVWNFE